VSCGGAIAGDQCRAGQLAPAERPGRHRLRHLRRAHHHRYDAASRRGPRTWAPHRRAAVDAAGARWSSARTCTGSRPPSHAALGPKGRTNRLTPRAPKAFPLLAALCLLAVACGGGQNGGGTPSPTPATSSSSAVAEQFLGLGRTATTTPCTTSWPLLAGRDHAREVRRPLSGHRRGATITGVSYIFDGRAGPDPDGSSRSPSPSRLLLGDIPRT